jgi:hypothetical protein
MTNPLPPVLIEYRGGPRNSETQVFETFGAVPDGERHEYLDANLRDANGPKLTDGSYRLVRTGEFTGVMAWHFDGEPLSQARYLDETKNAPVTDGGEVERTRPRMPVGKRV